LELGFAKVVICLHNKPRGAASNIVRSPEEKMTIRAALFALLLSGILCFGASSANPGPSDKLILEVINRHFTMGRKIPSVFLRVFSDGTVECHEVKWTGEETDTIKKKTLDPGELKSLNAVLENPELP
jgi:hypothetical protein